MPSAPESPKPRVEAIGHRGIPAQRRENTLEGFVVAVDEGANAVELDVHLTADGAVVVHHDPDVAGNAIRSLSRAQLQKLDAQIPTLDDVFDAIGKRATIYVELKGEGVERAALETIRRHSTSAAVHSFDHAAVERAAALAPEIPRGVLIDSGATNPIQAMQRAVSRTGARDVWPHWSLVSGDMMRAANESKIRVIPWTVNSPTSARHLASLGVAGLCSDDVRILANL
jgi:glycerophosphoryl diester phosphodiesterase